MILLISIQLYTTTVTVLAVEETKPKVIYTSASGSKSTQLTLVTNKNPPYIFTNNNGDIVGTLVDKLATVMNQSDISYQIQEIPWKRALSATKNKSNTLIFPLSRTPEREKDYSWIIPLHHLNYKIYGLKGTFDEKLTDITSGKYTFICPENTIHCSVLSNIGVPESSMIKYAFIEPHQMINMVLRQRVNFVLVSDQGSDYYSKLLNYDKSKLVHLKNYNFEVVEYLSGNLDFDPLLTKKIQTAFNSISDK